MDVYYRKNHLHLQDVTQFPPPPLLFLMCTSLDLSTDPSPCIQFLQYWWEMIRWHEVKRGKDVFMWQTHDFANLS